MKISRLLNIALRLTVAAMLLFGMQAVLLASVFAGDAGTFAATADLFGRPWVLAAYAVWSANAALLVCLALQIRSLALGAVGLILATAGLFVVIGVASTPVGFGVVVFAAVLLAPSILDRWRLGRGEIRAVDFLES